MRFARGVLVVGALLVVLPPLPAFSQALSVASLLENPGRYDGKVVTVSGVITAYRERVSRAGNPYTTFRLQEGGASVGVFAWGHRGLREGARVRVTGVFQRVRRVGRFTFYNEIEIQQIQVLEGRATTTWWGPGFSGTGSIWLRISRSRGSSRVAGESVAARVAGGGGRML